MYSFIPRFLQILPKFGQISVSAIRISVGLTLSKNLLTQLGVSKGKYVIKVCDGTACHVRKSMPILEALYKELGLSKKKHTTDDMMFTVETVSCLGACGLAPTLMVNEEVHPKMSPEKVIALIQELRGEGA